MSETTTRNPNQAKLTNRGRVAAALATAAAVGAGIAGAHEANKIFDEREEHAQLVHNLEQPDALDKYLKGTAFIGDNHDKVVRIKASDAMPPDAFARELTIDDDSQWNLTQQIQPQADAQGYPGVEPSEKYLVEKALLSDEAIVEYVVPFPDEEQK